jgi:hypothetical protein
MSHSSRPLLILVAGPYRSGTGDDPRRIDANLRAMNEAALQLFRMGHVPATGESLALPLIELAGSRQLGDAVWNETFHRMGARVAHACDACLRIGGASTGADEMVAIFEARGRPVFRSIAAVPAAA